MARGHHFEETTNTEFHMYVGFCITAWAKVDEELFKICEAVLGTKQELASIVYYRTTTLGGRLDLVSELVPQVLPRRARKSGGHDHRDVREWTRLKNEIRDLLNTRTAIAHHPIDLRFREIAKNDLSKSFAIYVGQAERLRGRHEQARPLTVTALSEHCRLVQAQADRSQGLSSRRAASAFKMTFSAK